MKHLQTVEPPYLEEIIVTVVRKWNPKHDQNTLCCCGHPYERHFDSYEGMDPIGCKYCECQSFTQDRNEWNKLTDSDWIPNHFYKNGDIVVYHGCRFNCFQDHISTNFHRDQFDENIWYRWE